MSKPPNAPSCRIGSILLAILLAGCAASEREGTAACAAPDRELGRPGAVAPAFALLDSALTAAQKDTLCQTLPDSAFAYHFSLGLWLRNEGGLWRGGPVADSLSARGIQHPDEMSHVILLAYGLYLRGDSVDLDSVIRALERPKPPPTVVPQP